MPLYVDQIPITADTEINEYHPSYNYGLNTYINLGHADFGAGPEQSAGLLNADIASYLDNDDIIFTGFKLHFYADVTGALPILVYLYRLLKPFYEGEQTNGTPGGEDASTWTYQNYNGSIAWDTPGLEAGVDYAALPILDNFPIQTAPAWYAFDILEVYKDLDSSDHFGWYMPSVYNSVDQVNVNSSQHASNNPYVEITYFLKSEGPTAGTQRVTADPLGARNSHHLRMFRLDDDDALVDEVGLILCDSEANENFKAIEVVHTPQESLKTASGATEHADFEPPYSSLEIDDWSLGRGYTDHNKQKNAYLDAKGMYTIKPDTIYPCGDPQQAYLPSTIDSYMKLDLRLSPHETNKSNTEWEIGDYYELKASGDSDNAWGMSFVADANYTGCTQFHLDMQRVYKTLGETGLLDNKTIKIYEAVSNPAYSPPPYIYMPDLANLVTTLTFDVDSVIGNQSCVTKELVWKVAESSGVPVPFSLTLDQRYFVVFWDTYIPAGPYENYNVVPIYTNGWGAEGATQTQTDDGGTTWTTEDVNESSMLRFYITGTRKDFKAHFAETNRCLHVGIQYLDDDPGVLLRNGEIGLGLFDAYDPDDYWKGEFITDTDIDLVYKKDILKILDGPGSETLRDWARIVDIENDTGAGRLIKLTHQFNLKNVAQTVYSKYVINNSRYFHKITTDPVIADPIVSMTAAMGAIYVCFGNQNPAANVRMFRYKFDYTTPAVTIDWVDETYWADMMAHNIRVDSNWIWRIRAGLSKIISAEALNMADPTETGKLDYTVAVEFFVGDTGHRINSYAIYGDSPHLWIMKEDKPYEIIYDGTDTEVYEFRSAQMSSMVDSRNSRCAIQFDTYLHFAFHDGMERWHSGGDLLNHGPNIIGPEGMPWYRQGSFAELAGYANLLVGAYDAGEDGYSSLLAWNGSGWTELYRAPQVGERILSCYVQSMDGDPVDWLWFSMGSKIMRLPISSNPVSTINNLHFFYPFNHEGTLDSTWISLGLKDVAKYINKFKIMVGKTAGAYGVQEYSGGPEPPSYNSRLTALADTGERYYNEGAFIGWRTDINEPFVFYGDEFQYPRLMVGWDTEVMSWQLYPTVLAQVDTAAEKIQFRVGLKSATSRYPMAIDSIVMDSIVRLPHKTEIRVQFRLKDNDSDRLGMPDPYATVKEKYDLLDAYSNLATPVYGQLDAKFIGERQWFIDQGSLQVVDKLRDQNIETWIMTMVLKEA